MDGEEELSELGSARSGYSVASSEFTEGGGPKLLQKRALFRLINKPDSDWNARALKIKPLKAVLMLPEFEQSFFMHPVEEQKGFLTAAELVHFGYAVSQIYERYMKVKRKFAEMEKKKYDERHKFALAAEQRKVFGRPPNGLRKVRP